MGILGKTAKKAAKSKTAEIKKNANAWANRECAAKWCHKHVSKRQTFCKEHTRDEFAW